MKIDFSNYKFRASSIKKIMTNSRSKKDLLSKTTQTYLHEIYIQEVYGRRKPVSTGPMKKGTIVETNSMELYQKVTNLTHFKNNDHLENEFVTGTPDIIGDEFVKDIKSSWDLWTFTSVNKKSATSNYYYQILTYMWLTGKKKGSLNYALVNTPETIIHSEFSKLAWSLGDEEAEKITRLNHIFDDIPEEKRLKQYFFDYSQTDIDAVKKRIEECRNYLVSLDI